ncbi:pilin [Aliivibrio sp. S4TY2]|uniref:pilin n=1 Tax=unclassified Aliivibrio TaxID=2645654 RepID=UPI0023782A7B|nr:MULTISPECIES: pilin [unclassified Aliivibrio]MDD9155914.1 pilin [Aliivibrio sp. S4TY2]MDD9159406.1 pilin [Aliivibrio sp. S4TY1]MDD9163622.1 pilin [Aliivibrio sp. S4MY2]MDD9167623.1 pilin [Aliivibrio sp. S4MY4]MDD9186147.1 pilin [Aliivibrio sp. S4MY3]
MQKRQGQKGFTLIELMIVVAVIGVLSAIAIPQYQNYVKKGALGAALASASALKTNVEDVIATTGNFPSGTSAAFNIGTIELDSTASDASGTIKASITKGAGNGSNVTLSRTDDGIWTCVNSENADIKITGCS